MAAMRAFRQCDVLDDPAEALIYSTNVLLNCTGGVGGALLERYGMPVQRSLHQWLTSRGLRFASQGDVIDLVAEGMPYLHVLHTVPCDGMYDTSPAIVTRVLTQALEICAADPSVHRVALSALATGYGHLPFDEFLPIAATLMKAPQFSRLAEIVVCFRHEEDFKRAGELNETLGLGLDALER
jgi:O-acetyl-ADP-ribose deacetylase (regulator of RNase III)